jgi:hypothetical protein
MLPSGREREAARRRRALDNAPLTRPDFEGRRTKRGLEHNEEETMLSKRTLVGALLAGLGVSLAGCYEPTAYSGAYYGGYGPVYGGGYYTWPYYGGPYYGGYYWRRGYVWRPGYYRYPYRHGVYYRSYGGHY